MVAGITNPNTNYSDTESGVSHMLEYLIITAVVVVLFMIMVPMVTEGFIRGPTEQLTESAYTDIGNGVSTRIIDLYAIIPYDNVATITTKFDIPDDVAGRDYQVEIKEGETIRISGGSGISSTVSLAGIGNTIQSIESTTASGLNQIEYKSTPPP